MVSFLMKTLAMLLALACLLGCAFAEGEAPEITAWELYMRLEPDIVVRILNGRLGSRQLEAVGIRECLLIVGHGADFVMRFTIDRFGLSLSNDGDGLLNVSNGHLGPYPTHTGQNDNNGQKS